MTSRLIHRIIMLVLGGLVFTTVLQTQILQKPVEVNSTLPKSYPIHASDLLWQKELEVRNYINQHPDAMKPNALYKTNAWGFTVGSTHAWYADDLSPASGSRYLVSSTCKAVGTNCYIFVEDASWTSGRVNQNAVDSCTHLF